MKIKHEVPIAITTKPGAVLPKYATTGSAGFDFHAYEDVLLGPFSTHKVPTGLSVALVDGFEIQVRPRSGLSLNTAVRVANAPGTIDSDYRGEIMVILENTGSIAYQVRKGDRIAQGVLCPYFRASWQETQELEQTERGDKGFGSSG